MWTDIGEKSAKMKIESNNGALFHPIGVFRGPHTVPEKTPIQPPFASGSVGRVELKSEYVEGLKDIEGFSHIILLYHFHRAGAPLLAVRPFLDDVPRGVFATRHPRRPNPIGVSIVRLLGAEKNVLHVADVDILDETPIFDIKPYVDRFDRPENPRIGWMANVDENIAQTRGGRGWKKEEKDENS